MEVNGKKAAMSGDSSWDVPYTEGIVDDRLRGVQPAELISMLRSAGLSIATAESLTGGGLCSRLVDVPGASDVVLGGVCTYTSEKKKDILHVTPELLDEEGPVHARVASEMACAAQRMFGADVAISTTGVAGPGPADGHPAGTVYIACTVGSHVEICRYTFTGERAQVRDLSIRAGIHLTQTTLKRALAHKKDGFSVG